MTAQPPVIRILAGVAGRSLAFMIGMTSGAVEALSARLATAQRSSSVTPQPIVLGVSAGAFAAAVVAMGINGSEARRLAADFPEVDVLGKRSLRGFLTKRELYPDAQLRRLADAIVGDRTFADFALPRELSGLAPRGLASALIIPVYSATHGTLLLPRDLPKLGFDDLPVADVLVAATRFPGALPAAAGLEDLFDGGLQYRVPHEVFAPDPALILEMSTPEPHNSRGGLVFPLMHPALPVITDRPRPYNYPTVRDSTIFGNLPYGSAMKPPAQTTVQQFDRGYVVAQTWIRSRTHDQLRALGIPTAAPVGDRRAG
ncbi:patatin-like phospholipase family protein [Nocardia sp. NPDC127579]|uniref:patatin-like phospholipase family protein n=1 Tax=Nocardia sp. NPDC127579 TaxID=3345402 RepID=UPI00363E7179